MDKIHIIWQEPEPLWERFSLLPISNESHLIRIHIPTFVHENPNLRALLDTGERSKMERFLRPKDKEIFLTSTAARKILCGVYLKQAPLEVKFGKNEHQKPFLAENQYLHFNISHSGDWLVFLFSSSTCGVDIEKIKADFDFDGMMQSVFHPREIDWINAQRDRKWAFFKLWTMKESLVKAQGTGLVDDLNQLDLMSANDSKGKIWTIRTFMTEENYVLSCCLVGDESNFRFFDFSKVNIPPK